MLGMDQDHDLHITLPDVLLRISDILKPQNFFSQKALNGIFKEKLFFFFLLENVKKCMKNLDVIWQEVKVSW